MLKNLTYSFLFISQIAYSFDFKFKENIGLILTADNCKVLEEQRKHLCSLKNKLDPNDNSFRPINLCLKKGGKFELIIDQCLPDFMFTQTKAEEFNHGANCWGTALNFHSYSNKPRYVWSDEMTYWLESPLCRKLKSGEQKQAGDIINTYGPEYYPVLALLAQEGGLDTKVLFNQTLYPGKVADAYEFDGPYTGYHWPMHSALWISSKLVYGKNSPNKMDRYRFDNLNELYARPRDNSLCQENQKIKANRRINGNSPQLLNEMECNYFSNVYRCTDFKLYFKNIKLTSQQKKLLLEIEEINKYSETLSKYSTENNFNLPDQNIKLIIKLSNIFSAHALEELKDKNISKTQEMLNVWKYFSSSSLVKTLKQANKI